MFKLLINFIKFFFYWKINNNSDIIITKGSISPVITINSFDFNRFINDIIVTTYNY